MYVCVCIYIAICVFQIARGGRARARRKSAFPSVFIKEVFTEKKNSTSPVGDRAPVCTPQKKIYDHGVGPPCHTCAGGGANAPAQKFDNLTPVPKGPPLGNLLISLSRRLG